MRKKILVTGATGHLGKEVINQLLRKENAQDIYALVRDTRKAAELKTKGIQILRGDYADYTSLANAFEGVEKLYFVSASDVVNRLPLHENVVRAAVTSEVGHIVYTSGQRKSEDGSSPAAHVTDAHWQTDNLIVESGLTYTIMKHALYADILPMFLGDKVLENGIHLPAGEGRVSFATRKDMAIAGASVLMGEGHENQVYEISGDTSYSFYDIADMLIDLSGESVDYYSTTVEEFTARMEEQGVPAQQIAGMASFAEAIEAGEFDFPDIVLGDLLGRDPEPLKDYLKRGYKLKTAGAAGVAV